MKVIVAKAAVRQTHGPEQSRRTHHPESPRSAIQLLALTTAILLALTVALIFGGCTQMSGRKPSDSDLPSPADLAAANRVSELARVNQTLLSFSGVGKLTVKRNGQTLLKERVAWVGAAPDKLSLVVFISGFPTLRFASDGEWFYLIEPRESKSVYRRIPASDSALSQIIGIEISFEEVIALLRGRVPLTDFRSVRLTPGPVVPGDELALRKWWGVQQKLWLETGGSKPLSMEYYDRSGQQRYRVVFDDTMRVESYQVPQRLNILAGDEAEFSLEIDRYLPNPEVSPDMFVLKPIK